MQGIFKRLGGKRHLLPSFETDSNEHEAKGTMNVRVYRYGLLPPTAGAHLVREQMRRAHLYRNALTELERGRRAAMRALLSAHGDVGTLESAIEKTAGAVVAAVRAVKAANAEQRSKHAPPELRSALTLARDEHRAAVAALREYRAKVRDKAALTAAMNALPLGTSSGNILVDRYLVALLASESVTGGPNSRTREAAREERAAAAYAVLESDVQHPLRLAICTDAINLRAAEMQRSAREHCGLYPGNYLAVETAMEAVRQLPLYDGAEPNDPRFVRWTGEGSVSVQIQGGLPVASVFGGDTHLRIEERTEVSLRKDGTPRRQGKGFAEARTLSLRVGTDGRLPVFAVWPMRMHRPLPSGTIRGAKVHMHKIGPREEWAVTITVDMAAQRPEDCDRGVTPSGWQETPDNQGSYAMAPVRQNDAGNGLVEDTGGVAQLDGSLTPERSSPCGSGLVAIDIGWRKLGDELRVAAWVDDSGNQDELRLTPRQIAGLRKPDEIRSIRDRLFNTARDTLAAWLDAPGRTVPAWLTKMAATLRQWRSQARLARLADVWRASRFPGDEVAFGRRPTRAEQEASILAPGIAGWAARDRHLWEYESGQRSGSLRNRRDVYRCFAAKMARTYSVIVLEKFDLRQIARRPAADAPSENETARSNRQLAAVSELRLSLQNACSTHGAREERVDAVDSTRECHLCHHVDTFDAAADVMHTCSSCGAVRDQDYGAAFNLLARYERSRDAPEAAAARAAAKANDPARMSARRQTRAKRFAAGGAPPAGTAREAAGKSAG